MKTLKSITTILSLSLMAFIAGGVFTAAVFAAPSLAQKLAGRFLLAVEDKGKIWYVDPVSLKRELVDGPKGCWELAKNKKMGISNQNLGQILDEWIIYKNDNIGISFKYPSGWGKVKLSIEQGESGKKFIGNFNEGFISFGGITHDYTAGRGGNFTDTTGYIVQDGKYFFKFKDTTIEISKNMIVNEVNTQNGKALILRDKDDMFGPGENAYGVIINLKGTEFRGIAFQDTDAVRFPLKQLEQIISTVSVYTTKADPTANWQIYSNDKYGYQLRYPANWYVDNTYSESDFSQRGLPENKDFIGGDTTWSNYQEPGKYTPSDIPLDIKSIFLMIYKIDPGLSLDLFVQEKKLTFDKKYNIEINGIKGIKLYDLQLGVSEFKQFITILLKTNDRIFKFNHNNINPVDASAITEEMVNSFKIMN